MKSEDCLKIVQSGEVSSLSRLIYLSSMKSEDCLKMVQSGELSSLSRLSTRHSTLPYTSSTWAAITSTLSFIFIRKREKVEVTLTVKAGGGGAGVLGPKYDDI